MCVNICCAGTPNNVYVFVCVCMCIWRTIIDLQASNPRVFVVVGYFKAAFDRSVNF